LDARRQVARAAVPSTEAESHRATIMMHKLAPLAAACVLLASPARAAEPAVTLIAGGDVEWSKFVADDATAIAQLEELRAQGADLFGAAKNAVDKQDRLFVEHHDGVIDYLDKTATKLVDSDDLLVYRITRP
jgi:hypothetical protein